MNFVVLLPQLLDEGTDEFDVENAENFRSVFFEPHFGHGCEDLSSDFQINVSKSVPHSLQWYSKMGIIKTP
ncbi:MAG: hypothetical protein A2161_07355 [Candidatus Schekmanbacteria bacterium RBG_13_48_7]|uniref:Uncharacterized protein n=1 Tax=Candidatus Schekmanbacteria bacterium RBG_13_48_7 TaxID=1817878 RepID=A0A1F7S655_9BACT|nr:MAG: hypothetical protein A2161_07355 [Candidatus Schekmanbacteria bacterium RBG_13_48_7]